MAATEVVRLHLFATQVDGQFGRERDARQADGRSRRVLVIRLLDVGQIGADVLVRDDLGNRQHLEVAAGVVVVLVGVEDVAQRPVGNRLDLGEDVGVVAIEHVVDQDHPFRRHVESDVASLTRDHVQLPFTRSVRRGPGVFAVWV